MSRFSRQTLVPGLGLALVLGLALAVTSGSARRPETALREAARAYAGALAAGDAEAAATSRSDRDPGPEERRAHAFRGAYWAVRAVQLAAGGDEGRVTVLWVGPSGTQWEERQVWTLENGGRWAFRALTR